MESCLDNSQTQVTYKDFINKELIHFSHADMERSIPNLYDGLKPGQRKILFCAFKRNLKSEIKVRYRAVLFACWRWSRRGGGGKWLLVTSG